MDPDRLHRLVAQADLEDDEEVQQLLALASAVENDHTRRQIRRLIGLKAADHVAHPFDAPDTSGTVRLGAIPRGGELRLDRDALNRHMLVIGQTGAGKTTLFYNLIDQVDVPVWIYDRKQDYRHLATQHDDLLVLPWTKLRFNPLQPPKGVAPRRWVQVFADVFGHATALLSGSKNYLMKQVVQLYRAYGVLDGGDQYPSLHDLQAFVEENTVSYARRTSNYRDSVLNRLDAITLTAGTTFDCSRGYSIPDLLRRDVVFEFDGLGRDAQNALMELLFAHVFEYRLASGGRDDGLRHVFFLDEGKRIFSAYKERQDAAGIPEIDDMTAQMREFGEALVVADQEATKLTESIKANSFVKVLMGAGDATQFGEMADAIGLSPRQRDIAQRVDVGEAVVQVGNTEPVLADLDDYQLRKNVTDDELVAMMASEWQQLSSEPRVPLSSFEPGEGGEPGEPREEPEGRAGTPADLSEEADHLLQDIVENPYVPVTDRYERLFTSRSKGHRAKTELVEAGIVEEADVDRGGNRLKLLEVTEDGREYLAAQDVELERAGRGGIVHRYWQNRIQERALDQGCVAVIEADDADVAIDVDDAYVAVEVAMENREREADHVADRIDTGFDTVVVACRNEVVEAGIGERLADRGLLEDDVRVRRLQTVDEWEFSDFS